MQNIELDQRASKAMLDTPSSPSRLSLLTLPREIRDDIYINLFLQCEAPPPSSPSEAGRRQKSPNEQFFDRHISYTPNLPPIPSIALLACCRQTRREIHAILGRKDLAEQRRATMYQLDCMVEHGHYIVWPTWTRLPGSLAHVHVLEVNLRIFPNQIRDQFAPGFRFKPVFYLLQRLLHHGPRFYAQEGPPPAIHIELLTLIISNTLFTGTANDPNEDGLDDQASDLRLERVWEPFLALERYGLLSGKVGKLQLRCGRVMREVHIRSGSTVATGVGAWKAWSLRHPHF